MLPTEFPLFHSILIASKLETRLSGIGAWQNLSFAMLLYGLQIDWDR